MEKVIEQPWTKVLELKIGNHRMQPEWASEHWSWLDSQGKPIGPFAEPANSMLKDEVKKSSEQAPTAEELKNMEDCEYEQQMDEVEHGKPMEPLEVELDFDFEALDEQEKSDLIINGEWIHKLSARQIGRVRQVDPLLQSHLKPKPVEAKSASKKAGKRKIKLRAKHATRGEAIQQLEGALKLNSRKQLLESIVPGTEPV